jgi:hypothetical protein
MQFAKGEQEKHPVANGFTGFETNFEGESMLFVTQEATNRESAKKVTLLLKITIVSTVDFAKFTKLCTKAVTFLSRDRLHQN